MFRENSKFRRIGGISRVLIKHGMGDTAGRLFRRNRDQTEEDADGTGLSGKIAFPDPRRIRLALEDLGPSFIKLGQLFSTRADIFPPEYIEEFRKLQDSVTPEPYETIRSIVEKDLGKTLEEIFDSFDTEPIAAASVAQVHSAVMKTGEDVAVKVVRPGIDRMIRQDIRLMYQLAKRIEKTFELGRVIGTVNLVKEFERTVFQELEMPIEAGNIQKFSEFFRLINEIHIPKVYWELTTKSVLVMEYIPGIKVDQVEEIAANGIDPKEVAMIGLRSLSRQLMEFGIFHADPHPGNTIVMLDGRVSLVDFGIMGYLDDETMHQVANLFLGYAEHDYDMIMEAILDAGLIHEDMDLKNFRIDLKDISEPFYGRSLLTISIKDVYDQVIRIVLKHQIRLPRNLLLLLKTMVQTEALGKILGSDASIFQVMRPYAKELLERRYDPERMLQMIGRDALKASEYLRSAPRLLHKLLSQLATGRHRIELSLAGFKQLDKQLETGVNRMVVGVIIAASIIAGSLVLNSKQTVMEFTVNFFGEQTITLTALLGVLGYTIATVLGFMLIVQIIRSRKL
ncbi:Uncharacterized protein sll1770 [Olavius algarvensis associated proteobacterium Delta 3]|nr:Uncharacterized protein sll1770 [Olavius algarvensis associated proteobacterium Delta 3]